MKIGSHVSFSNSGLLNAANEAVTYGSSTFMIYTGAPQNTVRKPIEEQFLAEGTEVMTANGIDEIIVHAPYIINLGSYKKNVYQLAVDFLQAEMRRTHYLGVKQIVLHPGAFTEKDLEYGIQRIAEGLNEVLKGTKDTDVNIALETMSGKGSEIGRSFEEIAAIMDKVEDNSRLTVCMDTCHLHDAGYDVIDDFDGVMEQFDRIVGLDRLAVVHLNDSKNPRGASKDRHAPVGAGFIGFKAMKNIVYHDAIKNRPMILETPWIGKDDMTQRPMYEAEIALLRGNAAQRFGTEFMDHVERIEHYFKKQSIDHREFVVSNWDTFKAADAKAKKLDGREPMERLYDYLENAKVLPDLTEEQLNHRLTAWLASKDGLGI